MAVNPLYIYPNKTRMRLFFFSGMVFILISALLIYFRIYFWAYLLFFLGLFNMFFNFKKAFLNDPVLIVDKDGITDNMNFPSLGFIPWANIKQAKLAEIANIKHILVYLNDPEKFIEQQSFLKKPFVRSNQKNVGTCIAFRTNVFSKENKGKVLALINQLAYGA